MRAATAYFAGVGTVAVAVAAGLGGGLLLGDIMSPQQPKHPSSEVTRLEQRNSPQPIPAMNGASQPVPYTATNQIANTVGEAQAQPQQQAQPQPSQQPQPPQSQPQQAQPQPAQQQPAQPQVQQASTKPAEPKAEKKVEQSRPAQATAAAPPSASAAPEDSLAKARDADLKRDDRRAEDKRKWERRKWSDKRKWRQRGNDDLEDVEASVRDDTERRASGRDSFFGRDERRFDRGEQRPMFSREPGFGRGFSLFDSD
jgi:outer membrane biosynthesis protein TonB